MKIATFNIWKSHRGMPLREQQIIKEIELVDANTLCLQEVSPEYYRKLTSEIHGHSYYYESESLLILNKLPILTKKNLKCAFLITFEYAGRLFLVVNLHLPWDSIILKEEYIVDIIKEVNGLDADYAILAGDFNCSESSSVHQYLTGQRTLLNTEANPYWNDMAEAYADMTKTELENTLDLRTNPRWRGKDTGKSERLDRIYIRDSYPMPSPQLKCYSLFGKDIDEQSGYCASDHYGVVAEIDFYSSDTD